MSANWTNTIKEWFGKRWGASMVLPDGWYGRPYDNLHTLTSLEQSGESLIVVLDCSIKLTFQGLKDVNITNSEIVFGPFEKLWFENSSMCNTSQKSTAIEYFAGEVRLVA